MASVSDVSSIVFSNSGIIFVFKRGLGFFSLGPGDREFGNFRKLGESFWRSGPFLAVCKPSLGWLVFQHVSPLVSP